MSIERDFDVSMIAGLALREQIQQNYRPVIGVHKWFARRPGTLFRGLILAEFGDGALQDTFFAANDLAGRRIADPFMGGGTPLIEANRLGCDVHGFDVNPMSAWIVREEIQHLDVAAYDRAARALVEELHEEIGQYYRTSCPLYGDPEVAVKSFLWVKTIARRRGSRAGRRGRRALGAALREFRPRRSDPARRRNRPAASLGKHALLRSVQCTSASRSGTECSPRFIVPNEFNPQIVIEAKLTEDDGTARDKVTRVQHLGSLSTRDHPLDQPAFDVVACIAGRGFGVRREDMRKLLLATRGKVFTLQNMRQLVEHTRLREFRSR